MKDFCKKKISELYDLIIGVHPFNTIVSYNWIYVRNIVKWFKLYDELFKEKIIIDYGAGNAPYFSIIEKNIKEYYALDFYDNPLKENKLTKIPLNSDGSIPQILNAKANVIISNQVIVEVENHNLYFKEINKISNIGTKLFLTTPFIQTLGLNDKFRVSPFYINGHLNRIGYQITDYKTAGYLFSGMALSFNMCLVLKNKYDFKFGKFEYSIVNSIVFAPIIGLINITATLLDRLVPFYRTPSNFLIIAEKISNEPLDNIIENYDKKV